ncbi:MAG: toll/interleukin-1 receptor domain-containing protein [Parafilimonas sp.]
MQTLKSPLNLYLIWHPNYSRGIDYANFLYSEFCRDYQNPLSRGIGIPVFFRSVLADNNKPLDIDFTLADHNAVIVLVEDEMFEDDIWTQFFKDIASDKALNKRVFPVALSKYSFDVAPNVTEQFILLQNIIDENESAEFAKRCKALGSSLLNDLSRLLFDRDTSSGVLQEDTSPPVKLFISHAKLDGASIAMDFRDYVRAQTKLNSFFDANDIANGYDFEKQITDGVKNSVLVVFQTDAYSSREWCRIEIITAKRYKSPIVIVNAITEGEKRTFPYIGNAPAIRWNNNFDDIIDLALFQMLSNLYKEQILKKYSTMLNLDDSFEIAYLTSPPELFNFLDIKRLKNEKNKKILVLYPDPPLGNEELKLLNELDKGITFTTPTMLPSFRL